MSEALINSKRIKKGGLVFVISGPSGSGKTTIAAKILKDKTLKPFVVKSISFTTRTKRAGEKEGRDYFFIDKKDFLRQNKAKKILEWTRYLEYYYGTPKSFVDSALERNKSILMCLDVRGALKIKSLYPDNAVTIFIEPPSLEILKQRIEKRSREKTKREISRRISIARRELKARGRYDYTLINDDLKKVVGELKEIIIHNIKGKETYDVRTA